MMYELFDEEAENNQSDNAPYDKYAEEIIIKTKTEIALRLLPRGRECAEEVAEICELPLEDVKELAAQIMRKQLEIARRRRYMEEAIEKGMEQGRIKAKTAAALKLLSRGKETIEEIAEDSGLPLDKVMELATQVRSDGT